MIVLDRLVRVFSFLILSESSAHGVCTAPGTPSTHPFADGSGMLPYGGDFVIMTRIQIAMARKVLGWPLYTIVIALGQASVHSELFRGMRVLTCLADVGCQQLPNDAAHRTKLSRQSSAICPRCYILGFLVCVVYIVLAETIRLRALRSLDILWHRFLLDRHPFVISVACQDPHYHLGYRYLVLCYFVGRCICLLWFELWRGSSERSFFFCCPSTYLTCLVG